MAVRHLAGAAVLAVAAAAVQAQEATDTGSAAFERKDFAAAARLWRDEAADGSADAMLGLGLLSDLGLGLARDPATALRWYLGAADRGLSEAQFNVGVMLDSGIGASSEPLGAAVWYARAAANGNFRAQYNLGLLYQAGSGVPRNADLARYWFGRAEGSLTAARERLADLEPIAPDDRVMASPVLSAGALVETGGRRSAELVWTAPPGPTGSHFYLEIAAAAQDDGIGRIVHSELTDASAADVRLDGDGPFLWRVSRIDAGNADIAASAWVQLGIGAPGSDPVPLPEGRVILTYGNGDRAAERFAQDLVSSFAAEGIWATVAQEDDRIDRSAVSYSYDEDATLARSIADFLPALTADDAARTDRTGALPGLVEVRLAGGPGTLR